MGRWVLRIAIAGAVLVVAFVAGLFAVQEDRSVETVIEIDAPPPRVWEVLGDVSRYSEWNPFILSIVGTLQKGEIVTVTIRPPGAGAMEFRPRLLGVIADHEIRWEGDLAIPGLFTGKHKMIIDPTGDGRTRFRHEEEFRGLLVGPLVGGILENTEAGFKAMNVALKERVEKGLDKR